MDYVFLADTYQQHYAMETAIKADFTMKGNRKVLCFCQFSRFYAMANTQSRHRVETVTKADFKFCCYCFYGTPGHPRKGTWKAHRFCCFSRDDCVLRALSHDNKITTSQSMSKN